MVRKIIPPMSSLSGCCSCAREKKAANNRGHLSVCNKSGHCNRMKEFDVIFRCPSQLCSTEGTSSSLNFQGGEGKEKGAKIAFLSPVSVAEHY